MTSSNKLPPTSTYYELLNACADPGCPVCRVGAHAVKHYLKSIFNEFVNDRAIRDNLLKSLGFCGEHSQLLLNTRIADALGASIIYENIVKKMLRELPRQNREKDLLNTVNRTKNCMACEQRNTVIDRSINEICNSLSDEKMQNALQDSDGLCFPHLLQVLENTQNTDDADFLLSVTKTKLEIRQTEMAELIRKNDHNFRSEEITKDEALAWKKALSMVSGVSISLTGDKHG